MSDDLVSPELPVVLIAEDSKELRELYSIALSKLPIDLQFEENGETAFRRASTNPPDLLISDIMMPGWNGEEVIAGMELLSNQFPVVVISGYITDDLKGRLDKFSCIRRILEKPCKPKEISDLVSQILDLN